MTPHLEARLGDYADTVLMPGDPLRAKWIADTYLDDCKQVNAVRNCLGYTGTYKDKRISVQAGGMGQPSSSIYVEELFNIYNVQTIIRVGSCGAIAKHLSIGDIVVALTASTDSAMAKNFITDFQFSPCVTFNLLEKFKTHCPGCFIGGVTANDYFYQPNTNWWKDHQAMGVLAVDMETYMLYALANKFSKSCLSVNTVSDHLDGAQKNLSPSERETSFTRMVESVLSL